MTLTPRQKSVVEFIRAYQAQTGMAPSVREICANFGLKSPAGIHRVLRSLEARGLIASTPGKKRSWRLPGAPPRPSIPLLGRIAAGLPIHAAENRDDELPVDPRFFGNEGCFALRIQGDSMLDAQITDGDLAIIKPQEDADDRQIVAVLVENLLPEATLKILHRRGKTVELHAANSRYPPLIFHDEERSRVQILGTLAGIIRRS